MSSQHIHSYVAAAAIGARRIVQFGASDALVALATAAANASIGVTTDIDAASAERVDVIHAGFAEVVAGAVFTRGALLTADANGAAIAAAPSAGTNARFVGFALASAIAAGDIVPIYVAPGSIQG